MTATNGSDFDVRRDDIYRLMDDIDEKLGELRDLFDRIAVETEGEEGNAG